jgi:hypothetical protein
LYTPDMFCLTKEFCLLECFVWPKTLALDSQPSRLFLFPHLVYTQSHKVFVGFVFTAVHWVHKFVPCVCVCVCVCVCACVCVCVCVCVLAHAHAHQQGEVTVRCSLTVQVR